MKVDRFAVTADPNGTGQAKSKKVWPVPLEKHLDTSKLESKHMKKTHEGPSVSQKSWERVLEVAKKT